MLKLTIVVCAVVLAGTASAAGWRSLRVDASSEAAFEESVAVFQKKLTPSRRYAFNLALQEIWIQGTRQAEAEQREYTPTEYLAQLNGLTYEEVVRVVDPTGERAQGYRAQYYYERGGGGPSAPGSPSWGPGAAPPVGWSGQQVRGATQRDMLPPDRSASGQPCGVAPGC